MDKATNSISFLKILKRADTLLEKVVILHLSGLSFVFCPLFIISIIILAIYRQLVIICAKVFKKDALGDPLSGLSSLAGADEIYTHPQGTICGVEICEGIPSIEHIRSVWMKEIVEKIDLQTGKLFYGDQLFRNVSVWKGYPFFRALDPKIPASERLKEMIHFLNDDDKQETNFQILTETVRTYMFKEFSKDKPLLEVILLPNYTPHPEKDTGLSPSSKYFAVICRVHHSLSDGFGMFKLMEKISTKAKSFDYVERHNYVSKKGSSVVKILTTIGSVIKMPFEIMEQVFYIFTISNDGFIWDKEPGSKGAVINGMTKEEKHKRLKMSVGKSFPLDDITTIKKAYNVSGTAVLYAAIAAAARNTVMVQGKKMPPKIPFGFILPLPDHSGKLTNRVTGCRVLASLDPDPIKRLRKMHEKLSLAKRSTIPMVGAFISKFIDNMPRSFNRSVTSREIKEQSMCVSNLAGPKQAVDFCSYDVKEIFWACGINTGVLSLFVTIVSLGGKIRVTVLGDSGFLKTDEQADQIMDNFFKELEIYKKHIPKKGLDVVNVV